MGEKIMVYNDLNALSLEDRYYQLAFDDFNDWFASVFSEVKPAVLIAIARGAICLLQIQGVKDFIGKTPVFSDHALPFISDSQIKNKRILLFDDSVIFGSTISKIRDYLIKRGAIVFCAAYVVDRKSFLGETKPGSKSYSLPSKYCNLPIRFKQRLWSNAIRRHHDILIRSVLRTPSHYNLDFPTFCFGIPKYSSGDIPYLIRLLQSTKNFRYFFDVATSGSTYQGIYRYTGLIEPFLWKLFPKDGLFCRPYSKARFTFVPKLSQFFLTPIPQLTMKDGMSYEDIKFTDETLFLLWKKLNPPISKDDLFYHQGLFRLLTSFVAIIMGEAMTREIFTTLREEFPIKQIKLVEDDTKYILGKENTEVIKQISSFFRNQDIIPGFSKDKLIKNGDLDEPINSNLVQATIDAWRLYPILKPHKSELKYEILGKVFLSLRLVTDNDECRNKNPDASRLEVGLSYEAIRQLLLQECKINISSDEISLAIDMCVDNGQAVPKVILQDSIWLRSFYSGEGEDSQDNIQFKNAIQKGYSEFMKQKKRIGPLSPFDLHKLCASLKCLFPWLPISTRYYTFGMYANIGQDEKELIPWLTHKQTGPLRIETQEHKKVLLLNDNYKSYVRPTWELNKTRDFYDAFQYIATAFSKLSDGPKLLISTCRTHRHTYNAVAFEAHSWVGHDYGNFQTFISGILLDTDKAPEVSEYAVTSLYWCIRYISEAWKKYEIFYRDFHKYLNHLKKAFNSQGQAGIRFWQFMIEEKGFIDSTREEEIEHRFDFLIPILKQMTRLTAFSVLVLNEYEILKLDELQKTFEKEHTSLDHQEYYWLSQEDAQLLANIYNEVVNNHKVPGRSIFKTELPTNLPPKNNPTILEWYRNTLNLIQECFFELKSSLREYCKRYEVAEGDFPFSPDSSRRVLPDGSFEKILSNVYVLTIDIIGSTDSEQTNEFKECVITTFKRFKQEGFYFEKTGNDAYVTCCEDPNVLWDIALSLEIEGKRLKKQGERFGGSRKGLSFGKVRIVEESDRQRIIKDAYAPHLLPRAFGILDGIDSYCEKQSISKNSVIIVDESCLEQLVKILNFEHTELFWVKSKHFHGRCSIVELSGINDIS